MRRSFVLLQIPVLFGYGQTFVTGEETGGHLSSPYQQSSAFNSEGLTCLALGRPDSPRLEMTQQIRTWTDNWMIVNWEAPQGLSKTKSSQGILNEPKLGDPMPLMQRIVERL
jgi:hypothetical protein